MNESQFTAKLLKTLRNHQSLRGAIIWKHSDRVTAGIPDFSISIHARTLWVEVKVFPNKPTRLQWHSIIKLDTGCLLVTEWKNKEVAIWQSSRETQVFKFDDAVEEIVRRCVNS